VFVVPVSGLEVAVLRNVALAKPVAALMGKIAQG
jgi:hypothetical protein